MSHEFSPFKRTMAAVSASALLMLGAEACSLPERDKDTTSQQAEDASPQDHEAQITKDVLRPQDVSTEYLNTLATEVYKPVQAAIDEGLDTDQLPVPNSSVATIQAIYGTDFGISMQHSPEQAAEQLTESGSFIDITPDIESEDLPYLPAGLIVIKDTDKQPTFHVAISLGADSVEAFEGRAGLANAGGVQDINDSIASDTLRYVLAPTSEAAPETPSPSASPSKVAPTPSPTPETSPTASAKAIQHGPTDKPRIALSFDADMTPRMEQLLKNGEVNTWYNKPVIDALKQYDAPATLFLTGLWAKAYPDIARELAKNPLFEIGNHSYEHKAFTDDCWGLPSIPDSQDIEDIQSAQTAIEEATGVTPTLFRFPGLCHDKFDLQTLASENLQAIDGTASGDPGNHGVQYIVDTTLKGAKNGAIIVMHMHGAGGLETGYAPDTAKALRILLPKLLEKYELVTVSDLLEETE